MAKSRNQKAKILVLEHLLEETGENRAVTMQEILEKLTECGVNAERKSIYDDLDALREFGLDIKYKRGRPGGYYLAGKASCLGSPDCQYSSNIHVFCSFYFNFIVPTDFTTIFLI